MFREFEYSELSTESKVGLQTLLEKMVEDEQERKEIKKKYPQHFHDILQGHTEEVNSINFSEDGTKIVTGSKDKSAIIFNEELKQ